ncbi:MAG: PDDEXK nuclease domain-containing protein [Methanocorpusculum sp.]|nr:PDDEXK nuclease domain-containing protein [Methanocorpusculum sp.]
MRYFYLTYSPSISQTLSAQFTQEQNIQDQISTTASSKSASAKHTVQISPSQKEDLSTRFRLSYSHYLFLMRIDNPDERTFYEKEAVAENWSLRELRRQFDTALFERLLINKSPAERKTLIRQGKTIENPKDIVKDPYILEFLGLPEQPAYSETELEQHIISKLQTFLLELGTGYTFVARQMRLTLDEKHYFVDLVFYNRILRCFVLIDLKLGEITHQDIGQMQMYTHYFDRCKKLETENKTIGIILCKKKDDTLVELTLPEDEKQIFASKYQTILPDKKQLARLIKETE